MLKHRTLSSYHLPVFIYLQIFDFFIIFFITLCLGRIPTLLKNLDFKDILKKFLLIIGKPLETALSGSTDLMEIRPEGPRARIINSETKSSVIDGTNGKGDARKRGKLIVKQLLATAKGFSEIQY